MIIYTDLLKKIHELLNCNLTDDFLKRVGVLLKEYENLIKLGVSYSNANKTFRLEAGDILVNVKKTSNLIPQILKSYLNGHVVESVLSLQNFIKESNFYNLKLDPNYVYYRARVSENILRTREDMFHVPYTNRGNVTNKRYSISGHPCLYLGRSVYICWEELRRPHIENIYISAFKTKNKINVLDYDTNVDYENERVPFVIYNPSLESKNSFIDGSSVSWMDNTCQIFYLKIYQFL